MFLKFFKSAAAIGSLVLASAPVGLWAYDLKPIVVQLEPSGPGSSQTMVISNTHTVPIAIEVKAFRRKQLPSGDDELTPEDEDLLIYPPQMVLPPETSQSFQVRWVGEPVVDRELAFRIVTEQLPIKFEKKSAGERTADVTVRYRYEAALYIMPDGAEPDAALTSVSRVTGEDGSEFLELAIASNGTMRAILDEPSIILSGSDGSTYTIEGEEAAALQGLNVLPGAERRVQIPLPQQLFAGPLTGTLETRYIILQ
ncbi:MAG: fimbria/pilus periplasmic chaperone [Nisaea sp.]|jgi:fimbrial chaperone protein|uniref:fimbria/pilus periplasmic chaperone n=1 Tax=Nisaea sp. TaxID=2024842 RepID=UPI000C3879D4|nr:hypothetical protein [Erythrobacteraceae bacterium]|tara:strand:+ start:318 stop:1082 length:765 start_codon:yes stop_codon:yes gene_type:complete